MQLIDFDALGIGWCNPDVFDDKGYAEGWNRAIEILQNAPTVDAVPVVRCKDCKHRPTKPDDYNPITTDGFALEFPDEKCPCQCEDGWYSWYPPDDFFCARGKQKGEDE